jgi:hypothetical protein
VVRRKASLRVRIQCWGLWLCNCVLCMLRRKLKEGTRNTVVLCTLCTKLANEISCSYVSTIATASYR